MKEQIKYIISTLTIIFITVLGVNAWNGLIAGPGDTLDSNKWNELVSATTIPTGSIMAFNLATCPTGWIAADGNNSTPDLRGEFIRGLDNGRGIDPGRGLGTSQTGTTIDGFASYGGNVNVLNEDGYTQFAMSKYENNNTATYNGQETRRKSVRPRNIALLYCIKQ